MPNQPVSDEKLQILSAIPTQTLIDALWVMNWPMSMIEGALPLQAGQKLAGRAVTLRFVPHRPDLAADKPKAEQSAEYVAFELCGPGEVPVIDAMGWQYSSIGGDIKFYRLFQRQVGGLVTDGAVRDTASLKDYGFPVYSAAATAKQGPAEFWPWEEILLKFRIETKLFFPVMQLWRSDVKQLVERTMGESVKGWTGQYAFCPGCELFS